MFFFPVGLPGHRFAEKALDGFQNLADGKKEGRVWEGVGSRGSRPGAPIPLFEAGARPAQSDPSGAAVPDDHFIAVVDDGDLSLIGGELEHLLHHFRVPGHVDEFMILISRTGFIGVRSTHLAKNADAIHTVSFH